MDRATMAGIILAAAGVLSLVTAELIGTAQAGRPVDREYIIAVSNGSQLLLTRAMPSAQSAVITGSIDEAPPVRRLACRTVLDTSAVTFGYRCR